MGYLERRCMKFANNIFAMVCLINVQMIGCLLGMTERGISDESVSPLEQQIFGRRIRVENQSGIRLRLEICRSDDKKWESVLENNSSIDIGSLSEIPKNFTYEPYGRVVEHVYVTQYGTVILDEINKFMEIADCIMVVVRIKESRTFEIGNEVQFDLEGCRKNVILPNLFPSVELYMASGYIQGPYCRSVEEFKERDCINFARYVLGLGKDYSQYDINIKSSRLLEEWNPELYQDKEIDVVKGIRSYLEWAKIILLELIKLDAATRSNLEQMPSVGRKQLMGILEENARLKDQLAKEQVTPEAMDVVAPPPPPPPLPTSLPISIPFASFTASPKFSHSDPDKVCAGSPLYLRSDHEPEPQRQPKVIRPEFQINVKDLSVMGKSLRHASAAAGSSPKVVVRGVQEILPERWVEITQKPELITQGEFVLIKLKYKADEPDPTFLLKFKNFLEQVADVSKLDKLLHNLDKSDIDLIQKIRLILGKISAKLGRSALASDIHKGVKLKKVSKDVKLEEVS